MKSILCHLLLISLLFVSIEGAADLGEVGHAHTGHAHEGTDTVVDPAQDIEAGHCEHCCHGHTVAVVGSEKAGLIPSPVTNLRARHSNHFANFPQTPPTPPPNA